MNDEVQLESEMTAGAVRERSRHRRCPCPIQAFPVHAAAVASFDQVAAGSLADPAELLTSGASADAVLAGVDERRRPGLRHSRAAATADLSQNSLNFF